MEETTKKIINLIKEKINNCSLTKEKIIFGIVGGNSIKKVLRGLANLDLCWEKIHFYMVDERFVGIEDENSNYKQLKEILLDKINIKEENLHAFTCSLEDPIEEYKKEFLKNTNFFDIILLSTGEDGHIASLFPNHDLIKDNSEYFIKIENSPKPPFERISASRKLLENSKTAILLFSQDRQQAYKNFLNNKLSIEQCPAKLINSIDDKYVFTDFN